MQKAIVFLGLIIISSALLIGFVVLGSRHSTPGAPAEPSTGGQAKPDVVSETGIHWHAKLAISIKGKKVEIPANIGLGPDYRNTPWYDAATGESDIHTHDNTGEIHWEIDQGPVTRDHLKIGAFFQVWGKPFNKNQILDASAAQGGTVRMYVDGKENSEYENYVIHDGDQVTITFE